MNGTTFKLLLLVAMFFGAVWVTMVAFFPSEEGETPAPGERASPERETVPADYRRDPGAPVRTGVAESLPASEHPILLPAMIALAETLNDPQGSVQEDLEVVEELIREHRKRTEAVPAGGLNEEIVAGLRGRNAKHLVFIADSNGKLSENEELLDRFGTPYFFHPVSDQKIEVRSAGPDRKLWTKDDVWLGE